MNMFVGFFLAPLAAAAATTACGHWTVRKVSDSVQGISISLINADGSDEGLGVVRANGRECAWNRVAETETTTTCLVLAAADVHIIEKGLEFVRRSMREGSSDRLEVWLATNPPKLIVDTRP